MEVSTDKLGLTDKKIFQHFRQNLSKGNVSVKTKNLIDGKGDILFLWDGSASSLLTLNLKNGNEKSEDRLGYQVSKYVLQILYFFILLLA